jgi:hypothetical protein
MNTYTEVGVLFQSFLTLPLYEGECLTSRHGCFYPRIKERNLPTGEEGGWAPEPVWTSRGKKILALYGFRTRTVQPATFLLHRLRHLADVYMYMCVCVCVCICMCVTSLVAGLVV